MLAAAKHYRGFRQIEDEELAARQLLVDLLERAELARSRRSLVLRFLRALPFGEEGTSADEIRALASQLGDAYADFGHIRSKGEKFTFL